MSTADPEILYSRDRVRRLRWLIGTLIAIVALLGLMGALLYFDVVEFAGGADSVSDSYLGVLAGAVAMVLAAATRAWALLDDRDAGARRATWITGAVALLAALPLLVLPPGFIVALLGIAILALGLPAEDLSEEP